MAAARKLLHSVFFTLYDNSEEAQHELVARCRDCLSAVTGAEAITAGSLATEFSSPTNDLGFDVALHVVFVNPASYEHYRKARVYTRFVEENKKNWKQVRVFDVHLL